MGFIRSCRTVPQPALSTLSLASISWGNAAHWRLYKWSLLHHLGHCLMETRPPQSMSGAYHKYSLILQSTWHRHVVRCLHTTLIPQKWHIFDGIRNCSTKRRGWFSKSLFMVTKIRQQSEHICCICWWAQLNSCLCRQLSWVSVTILSEKIRLVEEVLE